MEKISFENNREQRKILLRLLSYIGPHKKSILFAFSLLLLTTLGEIIGPILIKIFIDEYLTPRNLNFQPIFILGAAYLGIQVSKSIVSYFQLFKFQEIALKIIHRIRVDVFSKVQSLGLRFFDKTPAGSIVSRVTNDTEAIKDMFVTVFVTFIQSGFLILGILVSMYFLNFKLAVFCTFILPVIALIVYAYRKYSTIFYHDLRERLSQLNTKLNETLQGMNIIQQFQQEERFRNEFAEINNLHYGSGMKNIKIDALLLRPAIDLLYVAALMLVLSYFGISSMNSPIEIGVIYAFVNYLGRFFEPVNDLMMHLSLYQQAIVSSSRVFTLIDEEDVAPAQAQASDEEVIKAGEIEFRNVFFSYDSRNDVLKNISFTAKRGETLALVGHTGSGKSTIANLLMRFYEFGRGEILIDGKSIKGYSKEQLRRKMGLVLQDPFLFYGTIMDNIRLYDNRIAEKEIEEAAKFVQAHHFIESLDEGYSHLVVEKGSTLSSGQRQLLAFARTMAAKPDILILDEATANIDTETEEAIQAALSKMREGRTTIAIAHRLSTIQDADQILVLHHGEVVERGTHFELLTKKGLYFKMYLLQNSSREKMEDAIL